jgi:hypothetical protein
VRTFRYSLNGTWYKGNTHIHTTASDGGKTAEELAAMYAAAGYDFLFRTDHWAPSEVGLESAESPLLWIDGVELDGTDETGSFYHVVCLGSLGSMDRDDGFTETLQAARAQRAFTVLAHPHWTGNSLDAAVSQGFDAVEIYNHVCHYLNGKGYGGVHWSAMLDHAPNTLSIASDDAHLRTDEPGWDGGWIMVNASGCSRRAILTAIRAGEYYSTCGPEFHDIAYDGERLTVRSSPVQLARLVGPAHLGMRAGSFNGPVMDEFSFTVPGVWPYAYLEIEDEQRRRAWTNPLFIA